MGRKVSNLKNTLGTTAMHPPQIAEGRKAAREDSASTPGTRASSSLWMDEKARLVHRLCKGIEQKREKGVPVRRAVVRPAWYWNGRRFRHDASKRVRLARGTLLEYFYRWLTGGKSPEAVRLRYHPTAARKITRALMAEFLEICVTPGVDSLSGAYWYAEQAHVQLWEGPGRAPAYPSRSAFRRALSGEQRAAIVALQRSHRAAIKAREFFNKLFSD